MAQYYIRAAEATRQMRVIIAGAGEVGRGVAAALRQEKRSVALIDTDPSAIIESQYLDCLLVTEKLNFTLYLVGRFWVNIENETGPLVL